MSGMLHLCKNVAATNSEVEDWTPADGQKFAVTCFGGNSPINDDSYVQLKFGTAYVWVIWSEGSMGFSKEYTGDGSKKLELKLVNNTGSAVPMAGICEYVEY
jgi:hypothetical protein